MKLRETQHVGKTIGFAVAAAVLISSMGMPAHAGGKPSNSPGGGSTFTGVMPTPTSPSDTLTWDASSQVNIGTTHPTASAQLFVSGNTLTISMDNTSAYEIDKFFFNTNAATDGLTGLTVSNETNGLSASVKGSGSSLAEDASQFGKFNWELDLNGAPKAFPANSTGFVTMTMSGTINASSLLNNILVVDSTNGYSSSLHFFNGVNPQSLFEADGGGPTPAPAPEPSTVASFALGGFGLLGLMVRARRSRRVSGLTA